MYVYCIAGPAGLQGGAGGQRAGAAADLPRLRHRARLRRLRPCHRAAQQPVPHLPTVPGAGGNAGDR